MVQVISALRVQKRNPNRVNVYLDGEFSFGLTRITAAWLSEGLTLTPEKIEQLKQKDLIEVGYTKALRYLDYRPRTVAEMSRKLAEGGFSAAEVELIIQRLRSGGLLGDEKFSQAWVENRSTLHPRGRRLVAMELRRKGVSEEQIETSLDELGDEQKLALMAGRAHLRRYSSLDLPNFRKRLGGFLARKGFTYGVISPVLGELWQEVEQERRVTPIS